MSARLAGKLYQQSIFIRDVQMARDARAVRDGLMMSIRQKMKQEMPDCVGCSRIKVSEESDVMRDRLTITVSCWYLQRAPMTGDRITCPDGFVGQFGIGGWESMAPKWPGPKVRGMEADFFVMDEVSSFTPELFEKGNAIRAKRVSRDVPQTAYEETW